LSRWPTYKHFVSYLGLSPVKRQSGKMSRTKRLPVKSIAGQIFRESAMSIANSKYLSLKGFYNRTKSKSGYKVAIKATARKLAILYYNLMRNGMDYIEKGLEKYEQMYREKMVKSLTKKAMNFGLKLVNI
jgi:transposase